MWLVISCALTAVLSVVSLAVAIFAVRSAARVVELPAAKLRLLESRTQSIADSVAECQDLVKDLANRVKMARVRRAGTEHATRDDELPDPHRDPDAWRKAMNLRLVMQRGKSA